MESTATLSSEEAQWQGDIGTPPLQIPTAWSRWVTDPAKLSQEALEEIARSVISALTLAARLVAGDLHLLLEV